MDFGIAMLSPVDAWKTVKRAEALGFSHAWFYDSQILVPDIFVSMALAAANTTRIKLGMGVLVPTNRIAPAAANGLASLNALAPGRIVCGLGTGFTARNTMGLRPMKLSDLREYIRVIRGLLGGETVECTFDGRDRRKIRFLNPETGMINIRDRVPIHLSAFAPKARTLTAVVADGWMTFMSMVPIALHEAELLAATCREVGRDPKTVYKTAFSLGCVLKEGEPYDSPRARAQAGPLVSVFFHGVIEGTIGGILPEELQAAVAEYRKVYETYEPADARYLQLHKGHLIFVRPEEERFVTADRIRSSTFTGTAEELRDRLRQLRDGGYDQFVVQLVHGQETAVEDWARVFEKV
ncbi:MAG: LLM class flavin-dependent oxidoreductase [Candidatus Binatia bacterium]